MGASIVDGMPDPSLNWEAFLRRLDHWMKQKDEAPDQWVRGISFLKIRRKPVLSLTLRELLYLYPLEPNQEESTAVAGFEKTKPCLW